MKRYSLRFVARPYANAEDGESITYSSTFNFSLTSTTTRTALVACREYFLSHALCKIIMHVVETTVVQLTDSSSSSGHRASLEGRFVVNFGYLATQMMEAVLCVCV